MKELGIEKLFERHMFLLIGILLIARIFYSKSITWNLNRTIGWGWDLTNFFWWNAFNINLVYLLGYGVLWFLERRTHFYISVSHFVLIILLMGIINKNSSPLIFQIIYLLAILLFVLNIVTNES
ncbi:MAG: hypothetical protein IPJ74_07815 [Saprospiraceae bacterium]|nr:hypothetical protein [Saprospiraceae bacterium]